MRTGISQKSGTWASQDYVIETQEQFPKRMKFNVFGVDKIKEFALEVGKDVVVSFDVNAKEHNGKWYNEIRVWKAVPIHGAPANDLAPIVADDNDVPF